MPALGDLRGEFHTRGSFVLACGIAAHIDPVRGDGSTGLAHLHRRFDEVETWRAFRCEVGVDRFD